MLLLFHKHDHIISSDRYTSSLDSFPAYGLGPTLQVNGCCERDNRIVIEMLSSLNIYTVQKVYNCTCSRIMRADRPNNLDSVSPCCWTMCDQWMAIACRREIWSGELLYGLSIQSIVFTSNKIFMWVRNVTKLRKAKMNRLRRKA